MTAEYFCLEDASRFGCEASKADMSACLPKCKAYQSVNGWTLRRVQAQTEHFGKM